MALCASKYGAPTVPGSGITHWTTHIELQALSAPMSPEPLFAGPVFAKPESGSLFEGGVGSFAWWSSNEHYPPMHFPMSLARPFAVVHTIATFAMFAWFF